MKSPELLVVAALYLTFTFPVAAQETEPPVWSTENDPTIPADSPLKGQGYLGLSLRDDDRGLLVGWKCGLFVDLERPIKSLRASFEGVPPSLEEQGVPSVIGGIDPPWRSAEGGAPRHAAIVPRRDPTRMVGLYGGGFDHSSSSAGRFAWQRRRCTSLGGCSMPFHAYGSMPATGTIRRMSEEATDLSSSFCHGSSDQAFM